MRAALAGGCLAGSSGQTLSHPQRSGERTTQLSGGGEQVAGSGCGVAVGGGQLPVFEHI
ncbi:MAG: hypothetical protein ACRDR6_17680 [Pseudonocardiaceae bacterium]